MGPRTEYKVISANSAAEFSKVLASAISDHWRPILLTSAAVQTPDGAVLNIVAIVER